MTDEEREKVNAILEQLSNKLEEQNVKIFFFLYDTEELSFNLAGNLCAECVYRVLDSMKESEGLPTNHPEKHLDEDFDGKVH